MCHILNETRNRFNMYMHQNVFGQTSSTWDNKLVQPKESKKRGDTHWIIKTYIMTVLSVKIKRKNRMQRIAQQAVDQRNVLYLSRKLCDLNFNSNTCGTDESKSYIHIQYIAYMSSSLALFSAPHTFIQK